MTEAERLREFLVARGRIYDGLIAVSKRPDLTTREILDVNRMLQRHIDQGFKLVKLFGKQLVDGQG